MASMSRDTAPPDTATSVPTFARILCGVDGSASAYEAVRQAAVLCEAGSQLSLLAVAHHSGVGATSVSLLRPERAEEALEKASEVAAEIGVTASRRLLMGADATRVILDEAREQDLLVLADHHFSRAAGIVFDSTTSAAVHRGALPVLVARRPPDEASFPESVLVASDGSSGAAAAVHLAAGIARSHGSHVAFLNVRHGRRPEPLELASETVEFIEATGTEPVLLTREDDPADRIVEAAGQIGASLVVVGARGVSGLRALGSVSERVAHRAPCSVLVARPRAGDHGA